MKTMRRLNSLLETDHISDKGLDSRERTYFAFVPLNNYVCYAVAESYDDSVGIRSDQLAVESVLSLFQREPSMKASKIKKYIKYANEQLKRHGKNQDRLQASILVVVSDYTRIRYASCGNSKLFVVNDNQLVFESKTQTRYQSVADGGVYEDSLDINDSWNLTQYLGMDKKLDIQVSKKMNLIENSSVVLMTCGAWNKLLTYNKNTQKQAKAGVDIIDAYEASKTNAEFLINLEEMVLNFQHVKPIGSYSIVSCVIKKTFKEDTAKKKKRRKILIIVGIVLFVVLLIVFIVIMVIRSSDRALLDQIIDLDNEGVRYASYGNYTKALDRYTTANDLVKKVSLNNLQYTKEKKEVTNRVRDRFSVMDLMDNGNKLIESGNYSGAKTSYIYVRDEGDLHTEMNLSAMSREMLAKIDAYLEAAHQTELGELYELIGMYGNALICYRRALNQIELTGDFDKRKELNIKIIDVDTKIADQQKVNVDLITSAAQTLWQDEIDKKMRSAAEAESVEKNIDKAIGIYEDIREEYRKMGIADQRDRDIIEEIARLENIKKDRSDQVKIDEAEGRIRNLINEAGAAEAVRNYDLAIEKWEQIKIIYDKDLKDTAGITSANKKIVELNEAIAAAEKAEREAIEAAERAEKEAAEKAEREAAEAAEKAAAAAANG